MALTASRQRNGVSEGMAFGLVMHGCYVVPFDSKMLVDLAFEHAWRDWPDRYKSQFRQVSTDLRQGTDAVWVMVHADEGKRTSAFLWEHEGNRLAIYSRQQDWDSDDPADVEFAVSVIPGDVPLEGWTELASSFLAELRK